MVTARRRFPAPDSAIFLISIIFDMTKPLRNLLPGPSAGTCCAPSTGIDDSLDAERISAFGKALADPLRVNILDVLWRSGDAVCQCELRTLFDIPQPTLSHHLTKLANAGLVSVERRHRWAYYSIAPNALKELKSWLN